MNFSKFIHFFRPSLPPPHTSQNDGFLFSSSNNINDNDYYGHQTSNIETLSSTTDTANVPEGTTTIFLHHPNPNANNNPISSTTIDEVCEFLIFFKQNFQFS